MRAKSGFTLVEILIVVVILGILAAIVIPQFTDASTEAKRSSLMSNLQTIRSQIELYKIRNSDAPPDPLQDLVDGDSEGHTYLRAIPVEPFTNDNTVGGAGAIVGWIYDATTGEIKANVFADPNGSLY